VAVRGPACWTAELHLLMNRASKAASRMAEGAASGWTARAWAGVAGRLPLLAFLGVYVFTCYVGALALMFSDRFRTIFLVFSGAKTPDLSRADIWLILLLLHAGPLLLWLGYEAGRHLVPPRYTTAVAGSGPLETWVPRLFVLASALVAFVSLWRAEAWHGFAAWLDYNSYVYARWQVFDRLSFGEFVNLYTLLPLSVAYLVLVERRRWLSGVAVLLLFVMQYPLALRKVLLTSALLVGAALYLYRYSGSMPRRFVSPRWHLAWLFGGPLLLYVAYLGLTLQTVIRADAKPFVSLRNLLPQQQAASAPRVPRRGPAVVSFKVDEAAVERVESKRWRALTLYALFSPLTRTSISALAYPAVFPDLHPYYAVDVGQDILGFGGMPDDNLVVYQVLWPEHHRGSIAAPFHFVLYAQGGVLIALAGSFITGLLLAIGWTTLVSAGRPSAAACLCGSLLIVLGIFISIDSLRNSLIVSYGLLWGLGAIIAISAVARVLPGRSGSAAHAAGVG
jgi:hypothetical protein